MKIFGNWALGVVLSYSLFVAALVSFIIFSTGESIDLVEKDYYSKSVKYQERIDYINNANALSEKVNISLKENNIFIRFPEEFKGNSIQGTIYFYRPSDVKADFSKSISVGPDCIQFIPVNNMIKGWWTIKIDWSVNNSRYYSEQEINVE